MPDGETEYPSVRKALFGSPEGGYVANLYCAIKWAVWHLTHVIFALIATAVAIVAVLSFLAWRIVRGVGRLAVRVVVRAVPQPAINAAVVVFSRYATVAGRTARSKPITRRVYNYCPVDLKMDPKWYARLSGAGEAIVERTKPPQYRYACDNCDQNWRFEPDRDCWCDGHTEWVKTDTRELDDA